MRKLLFTTSLFTIMLFSGCVSANPSGVPTLTPPIPTPTEIKTYPTPAAPGNQIAWETLRVQMQQAEITASFVTDFGSQRLPSPNKQFLWVRVWIKNTGQNEVKFPAPEHFSALYAESEFKPTYGHRQGYLDYTSLDTPLFPEQAVEAWLRFDIPVEAGLTDLRFVFLPESAQIGVSPASPGYPWGGEHPVFVWECVP